jgi:hypothetical protein
MTFYSIVILIVKLTLIFNNLQSQNTDIKVYKWFGFYFDKTTIEGHKTVSNEIITILSSCIYVLYLHLFSSAVQDNITVERVVERYMAPKQQAKMVKIKKPSMYRDSSN